MRDYPRCPIMLVDQFVKEILLLEEVAMLVEHTNVLIMPIPITVE
jgi:hypothetical protein